MPLSHGTRLGPYEILSPIGAGGMGEVYKARDTRLDRTIAIKVLSPHTAELPEVRQRFEREARAVSALNHPHICTLYDIGQEGGRDYLVMEYLAGETLADRLRRGALSLNEALRTASEVADAFDRAHRTGIVHRDLKPGNIILTKDGAKVLDFGLAKMRPKSAAAAVSGGSVMQTLTSPLTGEGSIVGTLQYMAPEQLEGKEADERSDIFSFGAVLYEMATGRKPFDSRTQAGLIAQIMQTDPPGISAVLPQAPPALEQLARTCLAKDPAERRQTMRDVLTDLHWIAGSALRQEPTKAVQARRGLPIWIWQVAAVLFALATIALIAASRLRPAATAAVTRFTIPAPAKTGFDLGVALSPDGRQLAFVAAPEGGRDLLWIRTLDLLTARPLRGTADAQSPFWSPDGRSIGFFAEGKLKRVDLPDGPLRVICDAPDPRGGSWGPNGIILVAPDAVSPLQSVSAAGGAPTAITKLDKARTELSHRWPQFLPDGRHFIFYVYNNRGANSGIAVGSLDGPELRNLTQSSSAAFYSPPGFLLFARGTTLVAQAFSATNFTLAGDPFTVAEDVSLMGDITGKSGSVQLSVSGAGTLVYQSGGAQQKQLAWFDRGGKPLGNLGAPGIPSFPEISPDGKRVSADGAEDIWIYDTSRGNATRFALNEAGNSFGWGLWSPDGSRIVYASARNGRLDLYMKPFGGGGEQSLLTSDNDKIPNDWSRDGRVIVYETFDGHTKQDLWWLPLDADRKPVPYLQTDFNECHGRLSPDGKWLAYASDETGRPEIYVGSFPTPGDNVRISANGGDQPSWRRDGKELYYLAPDRKLMAVSIKPGATFESGQPKVLFQTRAPATDIMALRNHYAPAADGLKFLVTTMPEDQSTRPLVMVLNWASGMGKP